VNGGEALMACGERVRVGEMSHLQNNFSILSVEMLSQQRDILSHIWMSAHYRFCRKNKKHSLLYCSGSDSECSV